MPPASRPALSCAVPSEADTFWLASVVKSSGRAPYLSCWASFSADDWVNDPLICVAPPLIAASLCGAETTLPSRVNATYSAHGAVDAPQLVTGGMFGDCVE